MTLHLLRDVFTGVTAFRGGDRRELRCPVPSGELEVGDLLPGLAGVA